MSWESFLGVRLRTGCVLSCKTAQKYQWRLEWEQGWGSGGSASSARLVAAPLSPDFPFSRVVGSSGVEPPSLGRDGWQPLCLQSHWCHPRAGSARCRSTHVCGTKCAWSSKTGELLVWHPPLIATRYLCPFAAEPLPLQCLFFNSVALERKNCCWGC